RGEIATRDRRPSTTRPPDWAGHSAARGFARPSRPIMNAPRPPCAPPSPPGAAARFGAPRIARRARVLASVMALLVPASVLAQPAPGGEPPSGQPPQGQPAQGQPAQGQPAPAQGQPYGQPP